jgi:hypothetical protein
VKQQDTATRLSKRHRPTTIWQGSVSLCHGTHLTAIASTSKRSTMTLTGMWRADGASIGYTKQ